MQLLTKLCLGETPTLTVTDVYSPYSALWKDIDEKLALLLQACSLELVLLTPEHLRLLPPNSLSCHGHTELLSWTTAECQLKLSRLSTSLVEKHPVLQWCCATRAGTDLGKNGVENPSSRGNQEGQQHLCPCSQLLPEPQKLLLPLLAPSPVAPRADQWYHPRGPILPAPAGRASLHL